MNEIFVKDLVRENEELHKKVVYFQEQGKQLMEEVIELRKNLVEACEKIIQITAKKYNERSNNTI